MTNELRESLRYVLLPGKPGFNFPLADLHDTAFKFWHPFWRDVLVSVGESAPQLNADDFLRHEVIALIENNGAIAGQHAYCFFDLRRPLFHQHSFIKRYFAPEHIEALLARGIERVMSLEFLAVHPEFRASKIGFSLAETLITLGCKVARAAGLDGMIAAARADVKVAKMAQGLGATTLAAGVLVHGKPTDIIYWHIDDVKAAPDPVVRDLCEHLWQSRTDGTALTKRRSQNSASSAA